MYISTDKMVEHLVDCAVVEIIINPRVGVPPHRGQKRQEEEEEVVMMSHFDALCLSLSQPSLVFLLSSLAVGPAGLPVEKWVVFEVGAVIYLPHLATFPRIRVGDNRVK